MPDFCAAYGCSNKRCLETRKRGITFHVFPKSGERRRQWETALRRKDFVASSRTMLCSEHFISKDFDRTGQTVRLRADVVPTVFNFPAHLQKSISKKKSATSRKSKDNPAVDLSQDGPQPDSVQTKKAATSRRSKDNLALDLSQDGPQPDQSKKPRTKATSTQPAAVAPKPVVFVDSCDHIPASGSRPLKVDHPYTLPPSSGGLKRKMVEAESRMAELGKKLCSATDRERRSTKYLKCMISELRQKNLVTDELEQKLELYSDLDLEFPGEESTEQYSTRQREFALTLHLHGPQAYKYLRDEMKLPLPHPHTHQRWLQSVDCGPGFNTHLLRVLEEKAKKDPDNYSRVCLMFDTMAIRRQMVYDNRTQSMRGFVDLGDGPDEETVASEALVFMVNGVTGHWKAPIAYFFTRTLTPSTQKVLIEHALVSLHEHGIQVVSLVMDGHASNVSMCSLLGCQLKMDGPLVTHFPHPSTNKHVYILMDPCHLLRLVQNMMQAYSVLSSPDGLIRWKFIALLHDVQQNEGLHAANEPNHKDVNFQSQKMKVSLAAQTLSRSVATALRFMKEAGYVDFTDCLSTVKFIEMIDRLIDIQNSRNPVGRSTKAPLSLENWEDTLTFFRQAKDYLQALATQDGTTICHTKRYLSVMGFLINIQTLTDMVPELLQVQKYVLTYHFSLDHLQLLFNSIRAYGGWNNNPNVVQFEATFRHLMVCCGVQPSDRGNVVSLDQTACLSSLDTAVTPIEDKEDTQCPFEDVSSVIADQSYITSGLGKLSENVIAYIAGWVVRKVMVKLDCDVCRNKIVSTAAPTTFERSYHLLHLRNKGGLVIPSEGVFKVVKAAERCLHQSTDVQLASHQINAAHLVLLVKAHVGAEDIFCLGNHMLESQYGIDNHHYRLISLLVSVFHKLRQHHIARLHTQQMLMGNIRKKAGKAVLFIGQ